MTNHLKQEDQGNQTVSPEELAAIKDRLADAVIFPPIDTTPRTTFGVKLSEAAAVTDGEVQAEDPQESNPLPPAPAESSFDILLSSLDGAHELEGRVLVRELCKEILREAKALHLDPTSSRSLIHSLREALDSFEKVYNDTRDLEWSATVARVERIYDLIHNLHTSMDTVLEGTSRLLREAIEVPGAISESTSKLLESAACLFRDACEELGNATSWTEIEGRLKHLSGSLPELTTSITACRRDVEEALKRMAPTVDAKGNKRWYLDDPEFRSPSILLQDGGPLAALEGQNNPLGTLYALLISLNQAANETGNHVRATQDKFKSSPVTLLPEVKDTILKLMLTALPAHVAEDLEREKLGDWDSAQQSEEARAIERIRSEINAALVDQLRRLQIYDERRIQLEYVKEPIPNTPQVAADSPFGLVTQLEVNRFRAALITHYGVVEILHLRWSGDTLFTAFSWIEGWIDGTLPNKTQVRLPNAGHTMRSSIWALTDTAADGHSFRLRDSFEEVSSPLLVSLWKNHHEALTRETATPAVEESATVTT